MVYIYTVHIICNEAIQLCSSPSYLQYKIHGINLTLIQYMIFFLPQREAVQRHGRSYGR